MSASSRVPWLTSRDDSGVASSSTMVPVPWPSTTVTFTGADRFTKKDSSASVTPSPSTLTATGCCVVPGGKVRPPLAAT